MQTEVETLEEEQDYKWIEAGKRIISMQDYLVENLKHRYAMIDKPKNGLSNHVLDTYIPSMLYNEKLDELNVKNTLHNSSKSSVCISEYFANTYNIRQLPFEQMLRIAGYRISDIRKLLGRVKTKKYNLILAGAGGTGMNFAHWLNQMIQITGTINVFYSIAIFDKDKLDISNIYRIPFDIATIRMNSPYKVYTAAHKLSLAASVVSTHTSFITEDNIEEASSINNCIIYGAPDIHSRNMLSDTGCFISGTHSGNSAHLYQNPFQETDIQIETYGTIQLSTFFMNQLLMTIRFLEHISGATDLSAKDVHIDTISFDGSSKLPTDKKYYFHKVDDYTQQG